jgi:hypothetical protein
VPGQTAMATKTASFARIRMALAPTFYRRSHRLLAAPGARKPRVGGHPETSLLRELTYVVEQFFSC